MVDFEDILHRIDAQKIKDEDLEKLMDAGCTIGTLSRLYRVPRWCIENRLKETGLMRKYFKLNLTMGKTFVDVRDKDVLSDVVLKVMLNIGYCDEELYITNLCRYANVSYSHIIQTILPKLSLLGWIEIVPHKREKIIKLTQKGQRVFILIDEIVRITEEGL